MPELFVEGLTRASNPGALTSDAGPPVPDPVGDLTLARAVPELFVEGLTRASNPRALTSATGAPMPDPVGDLFVEPSKALLLTLLLFTKTKMMQQISTLTLARAVPELFVEGLTRASNPGARNSDTGAPMPDPVGDLFVESSKA